MERCRPRHSSVEAGQGGIREAEVAHEAKFRLSCRSILRPSVKEVIYDSGIEAWNGHRAKKDR